MQVWKIKLFSSEDKKISILRMIYRCFLSLFFSLLFLSNFAFIIFNRERKTLGDYFSKTKLLRIYWSLSIIRPIASRNKEGKTIANPGEKPLIIAMFPKTLRNKLNPYAVRTPNKSLSKFLLNPKYLKEIAKAKTITEIAEMGSNNFFQNSYEIKFFSLLGPASPSIL